MRRSGDDWRAVRCRAVRWRAGRREGFFLLVVLVAVAVATLAVYSFTETMITLDDAVHVEASLDQTDRAIDSAEAMLTVWLASSRDDVEAGGGMYDNPGRLSGQLVAPESVGSSAVAFTVVASGLNAGGMPAGIRYGLVDESSRLNVNALPAWEKYSDGLLTELSRSETASSDPIDLDTSLATRMLAGLPGMTPEISDAILDWIDADDQRREFGAESAEYAAAAEPYRPANGPIDDVQELLAVRGVTPELFYGADINQNGVLDADEQQRFSVTIETPGVFGWASLLTTHGTESMTRRDRRPKVKVNQDDIEALYDELTAAIDNPDLASFIAAYRVDGSAGGADSANGGDADDGSPASESPQRPNGDVVDGGIWTADLIDQVDLTGGGGTPLTQVLDLVGASVTVESGGRSTRYRSPLGEDALSAAAFLPALHDAIAVVDAAAVPGRLNVNTAAASLLAAIPGLDPETLEAIVQARDPMSDDPMRRNASWLWTEGIVSLDRMRTLSSLLCGGGDVFSAQVVGYHVRGGPASRRRIIIDASTVSPKILSRRPLNHLGRGFDRSVLGVPPGS